MGLPVSLSARYAMGVTLLKAITGVKRFRTVSDKLFFRVASLAYTWILKVRPKDLGKNSQIRGGGELDKGAITLWLLSQRERLGLPAQRDPDEAFDCGATHGATGAMDSVKVTHHAADLGVRNESDP